MPCVESNNNTPEPYLSVKQLARIIGMSYDWMYERTRKHAPDPLPCTRLGRSLRFKWSEVQIDLESRRKSRDGGSLCSANGIAWVNRKEKTLTRKRFQTGSVRLRDDSSSSWWEGFFREDVRQADGSTVRKQRTVNLGKKADIPTKRLAERKLAEKLIAINDRITGLIRISR